MLVSPLLLSAQLSGVMLLGSTSACSSVLAHLQPGKSLRGKVEMVYVPAGSFTMGGISWRYMYPADVSVKKELASQGKTVVEDGSWVQINDKNGGYERFHNDEGPTRQVYLDAYWIGKDLVTVSQFSEFTKASRYKFNWKKNQPEWGWIDNNPMVMVTWDDARAYCKWAGGDLPTEAQFEKAARGTDGREYPWGNRWDRSLLWAGQKTTSTVGSIPAGASPYGCRDMAGNAWEWCRDWYSSYDGQPQTNPMGAETGTEKVLRGGDFNLSAYTNFRSAYRHAADPKAGACVYGFRLVSETSAYRRLVYTDDNYHE